MGVRVSVICWTHHYFFAPSTISEQCITGFSRNEGLLSVSLLFPFGHLPDMPGMHLGDFTSHSCPIGASPFPSLLALGLHPWPLSDYIPLSDPFCHSCQNLRKPPNLRTSEPPNPERFGDIRLTPVPVLFLGNILLASIYSSLLSLFLQDAPKNLRKPPTEYISYTSVTSVTTRTFCHTAILSLNNSFEFIPFLRICFFRISQQSHRSHLGHIGTFGPRTSAFRPFHHPVAFFSD